MNRLRGQRNIGLHGSVGEMCEGNQRLDKCFSSFNVPMSHLVTMPNTDSDLVGLG